MDTFKLRTGDPDETTVGVFSKSQMDSVIQSHVTSAKLAEVSNTRVIGATQIHSFEAGVGDFSSRFYRGDVTVTSVQVVIFDQEKYFCFDRPDFFGHLRYTHLKLGWVISRRGFTEET